MRVVLGKKEQDKAICGYFTFPELKTVNETFHFIAGGPLVFCSVFLFLMIKRREKKVGKVFFSFR